MGVVNHDHSQQPTPSTSIPSTKTTNSSSSSSSHSFRTRVSKVQRFPTPTSPKTHSSARVNNADAELLLNISTESTTTVQKTNTVKETVEQRRVKLASEALQELSQLTDEVLGVDPELQHDDIRLREPAPINNSHNRSPHTTSEYTHPNLEIFQDEGKKQVAQSNYTIIKEALTTNFCTHEAWKALGLSHHPSSSSSPHIPQVTDGTREYNGITPKPQQGSISFLVLDDMFLTWLEDHQSSTGCYFTRRTPEPLKIKSNTKMLAKGSWAYWCRCHKKTSKGGGGGGGHSRVMRPIKQYGCRARFKAYSGISRPLVNADGGSGNGTETGTGTTKTMVGVTLIVYNFEHSHDIRHRDTPDREKETDRSKKLRLRREHKEQASRYVQALLMRGVGIRDVARMLGDNAKRCRDMILASSGETTTERRRFTRSDFFTKSDVVEALEMMQGMWKERSQSDLDEDMEEEEVQGVEEVEEANDMEEVQEVQEMEEREEAVEANDVEEVQEDVVMEEGDNVEEVSEAQWQTDILQKALRDFYLLKDTTGLDPELEENDDRLQEPTSSIGPDNQQLAASYIYTHPNLKAIKGAGAKQLAQLNYDRIMDSLTTNYFIYGAWILLGLNHNDNHSPDPIIQPQPLRIDPITQGTRSPHDGTTPIPFPGSISFHVPNDMFQAWLKDHQAAVGCSFTVVDWSAAPPNLRSSVPGGLDSGMTSKSWLHLVCFRHGSGTGIGMETDTATATGSQDLGSGNGGGDCKARITAYLGISKPLPHSLDGDSGSSPETQMVEVALVVYHFEHNHTLQPLSSNTRHLQYPFPNGLGHGRMERWTEQVKSLLLQGDSLQNVVSLFGGFVQWRRESGFIKQLRRPRESQGLVEGKFERSDFFTREDLLQMLQRLINDGSGGSGGDDDDDDDVTPIVRQDVIEILEEDVVNEVEAPIVQEMEDQDQEMEDQEEECYFTLDDISIFPPFPRPAYNTNETASAETNDQDENVFMEQNHQQRPEKTQRSSRTAKVAESIRGGGSLKVLKRYLDEWDNTEFASCKDQVKELVDYLRVVKPLPDLVPVVSGGGGGDGPQGAKRRRG